MKEMSNIKSFEKEIDDFLEKNYFNKSQSKKRKAAAAYIIRKMMLTYAWGISIALKPNKKRKLK